jgi:hypothetical protein
MLQNSYSVEYHTSNYRQTMMVAQVITYSLHKSTSIYNRSNKEV